MFINRAHLFEGVSTLLRHYPIKACKFCPELYIGKEGHLIKTCHGYRCHIKNHVHHWVDGALSDIIVSVDAFHLNKSPNIIKHDERFDFDRIPAVLELCSQAGADIFDQTLHSIGKDRFASDVSTLTLELTYLAVQTLKAWEDMRGAQKLLLVYPAKVCKFCDEVHVGPSGHQVRLCGVFKYESWRGTHFWTKARVDDLFPQKIVWRRRNQDPLVLLDKGRNFYGHAPAIVELCVQAGAHAPSKYMCIMKENDYLIGSFLKSEVSNSYGHQLHGANLFRRGLATNFILRGFPGATLRLADIGKTKVFHRAGQMAELDARRAEVLSNAAKTIQRQIRTHIARKQLLALRKATIHVQALWRGRLACKLYEHLRRESSAVKIQKNLHLSLARKAYTRLRFAAPISQTGSRAMAARNEFRLGRQTKAAIIIQAHWRCHKASSNYKNSRGHQFIPSAGGGEGLPGRSLGSLKCSESGA